jgi:phosphoenolpyruvate carboxykinase (ATP)
MRYAKMLAEKIQEHGANAWLINTGWTGQSQTSGGKRCPLKYTRAILDAIHSGELAQAEYENYPIFNLAIPTSCPGVPSQILNPRGVWKAGEDNYLEEATRLGKKFQENFLKYQDGVTKEVIAAGPQI